MKLRRLSQEEFDRAFRIFNALLGEGEWRRAEARHDHTDEFGDSIKSGEVYFRGSTYARQYSKVSERSMDVLLDEFVASNPMVKKLGGMIVEEIERERQEKSRAAIDALSRRLRGR